MNRIEKIRDKFFLSYIIEMKFWKKMVLLFGVVFLCYYISLKFIFPGYFDPLIPQNADFFYTYSGLSATFWVEIFTYPRPVGFFVLKAVGALGMNGTISFLIILGLCNIVLTILFVKKVGNVKICLPVLIIYLLLIFSQPGFYFNYTLDFFDAVAYFFMLSTMLIWLKIGEKLTVLQLIILFILIALCFLSKETYMLTLLVFWAWQFIFKKNKIRKNALVMFLATTGIIVGVLIQGHFSKSIWVNYTAGADDPYFISFDPRSIAETFYFYMRGWVNPGAFFVLVFSLLVVVFSKKYLKEFFLFLFMGLATYLPYSIFPNHKYGCYFWLSVPLSYSVILLVQFDRIKALLNKKNSKIYYIIFIIVFFIATIFSLKNNIDQRGSVFWSWSLQLEKINRNILSSFPVLKKNIKENDKVLIVGMNFGSHPFSCQHDLLDVYFEKRNDFIISSFGEKNSWTIFEYKKEVTKKCGSISYTNNSSLNVGDFDKILIFGEDAKLKKIVKKKEIDSFNKVDIENLIRENVYR